MATAIVTGATSGLGIDIARRLADDGFEVIVTGRNADRGKAVADSIGEAAHFVQADLTEDGAADRVVEAALSATGRVDVLVNNAGMDYNAPLEHAPVHEIRHLYETNGLAPVVMAQAAARQMIKQGEGGAVINITSRLASIGVPEMSIYSSSKGILRSFTTAAAVEWSPHRIRVNSVAPGMARTEMFSEWLGTFDDPAAKEREVSEAIPLGRVAEPADVAHAVSYLASPGASYITGANIPVDGGYTAK
ncbi:glucose 1-dehydrogenase [uncultured Agrococcus sp.]|uniref:SDR family NAD(P)-dependent oxidoreductase n=1 Tax=uncultured Agrococcus sp. TaxID=382258 RepID=UPI0025E84564|nr:glucose 1-dehydrogenase [uncultured Agrococcus sp.]